MASTQSRHPRSRTRPWLRLAAPLFLILQVGSLHAAGEARPAAPHLIEVRPVAPSPDFHPNDLVLGRQPSPPSIASTNRPTAAQTDAAAKFLESINKPGRTGHDVAEALSSYSASAPALDLSNDVYVALQRIAQEGGISRRDPISDGSPYLLVKSPEDPRARPLETYLRSHRLSELLAKQVDRNKLTLLPFVYSTDGTARLNNVWAPDWRPSATLRSTLDGQTSFNDVDFRPLRGKTVVVVGHIVARDGAQMFEIRQRSGRRAYLPLEKLVDASHTVGFTLIPLGCETDETMPIGTVTKINDVEALNAFYRAATKRGTASLQQFLTDLSGPNMKLAIDLSRLEDAFIIPIEQIDENDKPLQASPPQPALQQPPTPAPPLKSSTEPPFSAPIEQTQTCGAETTTSVEVTKWANWARTTGVSIWLETFISAASYVMIVAVFTVLYLPRASVSDKAAVIIFISLAGPTALGITLFVVVAGTDPSIDGHPMLLVLLLGMPITLLSKCKELLEDDRLTILGVKCLTPLILLPLIVACAIKAGHVTCLIRPLADKW